MKTLVLGLGNLLLADEGVGVHAARALMEKGCPEDTTVLDIGTAILEALPDLEIADRVIIIDAVKADGVPGSVYRMPYEEFLKPEVIASMHGFDLSRVLALTSAHRGARSDRIRCGTRGDRLVFGAFPPRCGRLCRSFCVRWSGRWEWKRQPWKIAASGRLFNKTKSVVDAEPASGVPRCRPVSYRTPPGATIPV